MIKSCSTCGGLYATENLESFAGMPCRCGTSRELSLETTTVERHRPASLPDSESFPSPSVSEAEDKNSGEGSKEHGGVPRTESQATSEWSAALTERLLKKHPHVGRTEGIFGGKLIVGGIRISVTDILVYLWQGHDVKYISKEYGLTLEQVKCAIAFAQDFIEESDTRGEVRQQPMLEQAAQRAFDVVMAIEESEYNYSVLQKAAMVANRVRALANGQVTNTSASDGTT